MIKDWDEIVKYEKEMKEVGDMVAEYNEAENEQHYNQFIYDVGEQKKRDVAKNIARAKELGLRVIEGGLVL